MKKTKNKSLSETASELLKWRQAFQKPASPDSVCPEPEQVISSALQELAAPQQQQVQDHLLNCRDCLELHLDVRAARAEAEGTIAPEKKTKAAWLKVLGHKVRETLLALGKPRRLVPALAAVSLLVLVVILGREEKSQILPPPQLAMEKQSPPATPSSAAPSQEPAEGKPQLPSPGHRLLAARPQAETAASLKKKSPAAARALSTPISLNFSKVPDDGARLSYRADKNGYAYLLRQDRNGKISILYAGGLEAGKTYYYPAKDHLLGSDTAATQATFFLVASPNPVADLETRLKELEHLGKDQMRILFPQATIQSLSIKLP